MIIDVGLLSRNIEQQQQQSLRSSSSSQTTATANTTTGSQPHLAPTLSPPAHDQQQQQQSQAQQDSSVAAQSPYYGMSASQACRVLTSQPLASRSIPALETLREIIFHEACCSDQQQPPLTGTAATRYHDKLYRRVNRGLANIIASGLSLDQQTYLLRSFRLKVVRCEEELLKRLANLLKSNKIAMDKAVYILSGGGSSGDDDDVVPGVLGNDFYPDNIQDIRATKEVTELINMERMEGLQHNHFTVNQSVVDNPLLVAGGVFADRMASLQLLTCSECGNRWTHETTPHSNKCPRCRNDRHHPSTYSPDNNMHPGEVPPQLSHLTFIEQRSISQICPMMQFLSPPGANNQPAHAVTFHDTDQSTVVELLPRPPTNLGVCIIVGRAAAAGPHQHDLRANRHNIRRALEWLKANNVYYNNIVISEETLSLYPDGDGQVEGLLQLEDTDNDAADANSSVQQQQQQQQQQPGQYVTSLAISHIDLPNERQKLLEAVRRLQQHDPASSQSSNADNSWRHQLDLENIEGI